jgi:hypothetical protein
MQTFQINPLIQFWRLLHVHVSKLMGLSLGGRFVHAGLYGQFLRHVSKQCWNTLFRLLT